MRLWRGAAGGYGHRGERGGTPSSWRSSVAAHDNFSNDLYAEAHGVKNIELPHYMPMPLSDG
jgi:hypothetical protein